MTTDKDIRCAHELLDHIANGYKANTEEVDHVRKFLPELPKPVTLDVLLARVHDAWMNATRHEWGFETPKEQDDWLFDLRNDLVRIIEEQDAPAAVPALPAGMRLADHAEYGRCVVSPNDDENNLSCRIFYVDEVYVTDSYSRYVETSSLTFIDSEPAHPEFLETEADYQKAPEGTIVARDGINSWMKEDDVWVQGVAVDATVYTVPCLKGPRRVLRWGRGK